jgi:hypothetical protein
MTRMCFSLVLAFGLLTFASADPIKKDKIDYTKLAKEHCVKFWTTIKDNKMDDAIKMMEVPFMTHEGKTEESLKSFEREFKNGLPPGTSVEITESMDLKDLNAFLKKNESKELSEERIKRVAEHLGDNGRVVTLKVFDKGKALEFIPFMMVKFKDNKPLIVGVGGER